MHGHSHGHDHAHHHHGDEEGKAIAVAFWLNFTFTIIEFVGGLMVNSVAILTDAVHDLGDTLAIGMGWVLGKTSKRKADAHFSYGYQRLSVLAAVINAVVLIVGSVFIISEAVPRLWAPEMPDATGMLWLAVLGVVVNGLGAWRLLRQSSMNASMIRWHLLEDVLGWVAVLIVSVVLMFWEVPILDPILSIGFTLFILFNVARNLWASLKVFLQAVPSDVDVQQLVSQLCEPAQVGGVHHVHVWSLDGEHHVFSAHVELQGALDVDQVLELKQQFRALVLDFGFAHSTIEVEWPGEGCRHEDVDG
ncbi:cation diffusion facilitator family transporter [Alcanivorax sp. S6407]|uniref:cation diffusion facilitator family transporter n=1 Tax=Alcanivorax sp. S6407 TaxID=2926424 RepID=UPI001FF2CDDB|nr:cation diffusion facilitator family transporter [Alcanivorax sp. S6407]MCK0153741.1 cation diffusion facilitator family transporter [Alcanivorax sp. S6407]